MGYKLIALKLRVNLQSAEATQESYGTVMVTHGPLAKFSRLSCAARGISTTFISSP